MTQKKSIGDIQENNCFSCGIDYYMDSQNRVVFTKWYHLKRGHCCESGCRHCPYGYAEKTSEKKKIK